MDPSPETLRLYGTESDAEQLPWSWVVDQLDRAGTYWLTGWSSGHPHPRPVWGIWADDSLLLSVGSAVLKRQLEAAPTVTVHLDSGTDVVIVEGLASEL